MRSMQFLNAVPIPARYFGLAGLLPFVVGAVACWVTPDSGPDAGFISGAITAEFALCAYGAVILSFLGGIRWGVAMQHVSMISDWVVVGLAMVPSLLAWAALLMNPTVGIPMVIAGMLLQYFIDFKSTKTDVTPVWFLSLRTVLTAGSVISLVMGWLAN